MSKDINSKIIMSAKGLVALAVLAAAIYWLAGLSLPKKGYVSMPTLLREAEKISPPSDASLIEKSNNHKTSSAIVSMRYKTSLNQGQIFEYYRSNLELAGWRHISSNSSFIDEYCKGALSAEVEFNSGMRLYTFSITWRQRTATKCGA
nr:hypothetical protein [Pseudomonas benzenivorans]